MKNNSSNKISSMKTAQNLILKFKKSLEEIACHEGFSGVVTGFEKLDKVTCGFQPCDLIIVAGRPSIGKSAFVLSVARNISIDYGVSVAFFSPEMSSNQLITRLISSETGLSLEKLRTGKLEKHEWELLSLKSKNIENASIYFDDTPNILVEEIFEKSKELVFNIGVKIIIIDNIHLISAGNKGNGDITREQELSIVVRKLKEFAKILNVPIIVVSQLSRAVETRGSIKRPLLSDLRGSGTLEDIADIVSFIYRPEYYKIDEWDDDEASPTAGQAELIIAKHRNGNLENVRLKFIGHLGKFDNLDENFGSYDDLPSSMINSVNPFITQNLPSANGAFGSNLNDDDEDSDVPF